MFSSKDTVTCSSTAENQLSSSGLYTTDRLLEQCLLHKSPQLYPFDCCGVGHSKKLGSAEGAPIDSVALPLFFFFLAFAFGQLCCGGFSSAHKTLNSLIELDCIQVIYSLHAVMMYKRIYSPTINHHTPVATTFTPTQIIIVIDCKNNQLLSGQFEIFSTSFDTLQFASQKDTEGGTSRMSSDLNKEAR